jgi:hypothetical protein
MKKLIGEYKLHEGKFEVKMNFTDIPLLNKALVSAGAQVHAIIPKRSLEDLFLSMTEHSNEARA